MKLLNNLTLKNLRCFLKRRCLREGVHFPPSPPVYSKTKDATTTKLCTVIVRHISTKNQQLDFPNFHCSIVCGYCPIVCLIIKSGSKMVKISSASYENEIHRVDSPFNENSKNIIFCQVGPNFGRGRARKFKENGQKQGNLLLCKLGSGPF